MGVILTDSSNYAAIADALRSVNGTSATYRPSEMASEVLRLGASMSMGSIVAEANGIYLPAAFGFDAFSEVVVDFDEMPGAVSIGQGSFSSNGVYSASDYGMDAFSKVTVNVTDHEIGEKVITANGEYGAYEDGFDGYGTVTVALPLGSKSVTANGTYSAAGDNLAGFSEFTVAVPYNAIASRATPPLLSASQRVNGVVYAQYDDIDYGLPEGAEACKGLFCQQNGQGYTPYIDTGIRCDTEGLSVEVEFDVKFITDVFVFGDKTASSSLFNVRANYRYNSGDVEFTVNDVTWAANGSCNVSKGVVVKLSSDGTAYIDGVAYPPDTQPQAWSSSDTLKLGGDSTKTDSLFGNIRAAKVWILDDLVLDLVPVLDPNGVLCAYDRVSDSYIYNASNMANFREPEKMVTKSLVAAYIMEDGVWKEMPGV